MGTSPGRYALTLAIASFIASSASAGEMLLHNFGGEDSGEIGILNPYTGAFGVDAVLQGITAPGSSHTNQLTYVIDTAAAPDGTVYASTLDYVVGSPSGYFSRLWKLDLEDVSNSEFIGFIGGGGVAPHYAKGLAFGPDGKLYAAGYNEFTYEAVIFEIATTPMVNPDDANAIPYAVPTILMEYGTTDYGSDIAFTCDGTMYMTTFWSGNRPLMKVDLDAQTITPLATDAPSDNFDALAYDPVLDALYGVNSGGDVYEFDRTSGAATYLSTAALSSGSYGIAGGTWSEAPVDSDLDGSCDVNDICPDGDDRLDGDFDGVPDACDVCPTEDASHDDLDGDGCLDGPTCDLSAISDYIGSLQSSAFSKSSHQNTLLNKLDAVITQESVGNYCGGAQKMTNDLLDKTDGDTSPPDWVVDGNAGSAFSDMLQDCIEVFETAGECN